MTVGTTRRTVATRTVDGAFFVRYLVHRHRGVHHVHDVVNEAAELQSHEHRQHPHGDHEQNPLSPERAGRGVTKAAKHETCARAYGASPAPASRTDQSSPPNPHKTAAKRSARRPPHPRATPPAPHRTSGGIGRRAGFRFRYRKVWGFKSLLVHRKALRAFACIRQDLGSLRLRLRRRLREQVPAFGLTGSRLRRRLREQVSAFGQREQALIATACGVVFGSKTLLLRLSTSHLRTLRRPRNRMRVAGQSRAHHGPHCVR